MQLSIQQFIKPYKYKPKARRKECDLCDSNYVIVIGARWAGWSNSRTGDLLGLLHKSLCLHRMMQESSLQWVCRLKHLRELKGEWPEWFELVESIYYFLLLILYSVFVGLNGANKEIFSPGPGQGMTWLFWNRVLRLSQSCLNGRSEGPDVSN